MNTDPDVEIVPLVQRALEARGHACAPYSGFAVGAALRAADGRVFAGINVESASYGLTCCAERVALFTALAAGARTFTGIAVVARIDGGPMPCGACRQLLSEYAPDARVFVADSAAPATVRRYSVRDLLPGAFADFRPSP